MKRIILHWTGGGYVANATDREHYHRLVQGDGRVIAGLHPISANAGKLAASYAAHTRNLNTDSIGVAVCAMLGAKEAPFDSGSAPITDRQVTALVAEVARLAKEYRIPVERGTILTHAEVQPTLGVQQAGKWDITWLPGYQRASNPVAVGDVLRARIRAAMASPGADPVEPAPAPSTKPPAVASPTPVGNTGLIAAAAAIAAAALFFLTR